MMIFTTSWDDGDTCDLRIADMLDRYSMRGTFYIARDQKDRLSEEQIRGLSKRHEIGAHTLAHADLPTLSLEEKRREIGGSKQWLESIIGKQIDMFCYPFGRFDEETKRMVREAGFVGARSTIKTLGTKPTDVYELPVTMLTYRAPYGVREKVLLPFWGARVRNIAWEKLAREKLKTVEQAGGIFHLWGHSWEIDRLKLWDSLGNFLKDVAERRDIRYLTNAEVVGSVGIPQ